MRRRKADVVLGVRRMEVGSRFTGPMERSGRLTRLVRRIGSRKKLRRQDSAREFTPNGALYLFDWDYFKKHRSLYADGRRTFGLLMDRNHSLEIDEPGDLSWAEYLVQKGFIDVREWKDGRKR
jgi:CMP-N-acetylneuraminic acid synthetase